MPDSFDLSAYCARIGYTGPREPTLATLRAIHALHPAAIPFENLDPLLGRPVPLDLASLQAKLIAGRRGGYCFEQNFVLRAALEMLGFSVTPLAARVRWMLPPERPDGPRTHMVLRVDLDGEPYLADVGFGGHLLARPIRLVRDLEQSIPGAVLRLVGTDPSFTLQTALPAGWQDVYRFTLEPQLPADYMIANWFTSTYPATVLTQNLLVQRLTPEVRFSLLNTRLTERGSDGSVREVIAGNAGELAAILQNTFGITPPAEPPEIWRRLPRE